jgi:ribosome-binding factor A
MSIRLEKVADLLRDEISSILLFKIKDLPVDFVSVTRVNVTSDFQEAFIYISLFGEEVKRQESLKLIRKYAKYIRLELGKKIKLKTTPKLIFREDTSLEKGSEIIEKLKKLDIK